MKKYRIYIFYALIALTSFLSFKIHQDESQRRELKEDLIELSSIKYGLFNVDEWKGAIAKILTEKINNFSIDEKNKAQIEASISEFMYQQIDEFERRYRENNKEKSWFGISYKNIGANVFDVFGSLKEEVPTITRDIVGFLENKENREGIRLFVLAKVDEYANNTFAQMDYSIQNAILSKYEAKSRQEAITHLRTQIERLEKEQKRYTLLAFVAISIVFAMVMSADQISKNEYLLLGVITSFLLVLGLILPMLEIDARISKISFQILGNSISFQDQVLYYRSKSILDVITLMLGQYKPELIAVGVLIFAFSVLVPISKLGLSIGYLYFPDFAQRPFISFLIFKTGKWSMADVMIVAIFMAYIGFKGILSEQLGQLDKITDDLEILTTNQSSLQLGFFLFLAFVLLSLIITHKLQYSRGKLLD